MLITNELIVNQLWEVLGDLDKVTYENKPGMCLAVVRQVIEGALKRPSRWLYDEIVTDWVQPPGYNRVKDGHWARDFERTCKRLGWGVSFNQREPGDIVFNNKAAWSQEWGVYVGHVAILIDRDMVFENIDPLYRPRSYIKGALALTPLKYFPCTLVARVPNSILQR